MRRPVLARSLAAALLSTALSSPAVAQPGPTLALGGDVLYEAPLVYQLRQREGAVSRAQALREVFVDLAPTLRGADLAIVNLETPIGSRRRDRDDTDSAAVFVAPDDFLGALRDAGVDVVTVANNHAYDQDRAGLDDTLRAVGRRGMQAVGAGRSATDAARAIPCEAAGARVAIAAWTEGTNHLPRDGDAPQVAFLHDGTVEASLREARTSGADLVVAAFHWTHEDDPRPRRMMREVARRAAEAGADLVVGHGPHVPGSTELLETTDGRRVHVLYSLGNLVAAMQAPGGDLDERVIGVRDAPVVMVRTAWEGGRLTVSDLEVRHHWIARPEVAPWSDGGRFHTLRPVDLRAELARLREAGCGAECTHREAQYRRRIRLVDRAMARLDDGLVSGARIAAAHTAPVHTELAAPSIAPPAPAPAAPAVAAGREIELGVTFDEDAARESSLDDDALQRLVSLLRADPSLRVEVIGHATEAEATRRGTLGRLRARRVMGLIAVRGPSRSRFTARGGATGVAGVTVRLSR